MDHSDRPPSTRHLVQRWKDRSCTVKERMALETWAKAMVQEFKNSQEYRYRREAIGLMAIYPEQIYHKLMSDFDRNFGNMDHNSFVEFNLVLHQAKDTLKEADSQLLGSIIRHLSDILNTTVQHAGKGTQLQLQLLLAISNVLDIMVRVHIEELDREALHEPLLKQLKNFTDSTEPRINQAANYTYNALLTVRDNEGPWSKLGRHGAQIGLRVLDILSSVKSIDLARALDSVVGIGGTIKPLFEAISELCQMTSLGQAGKAWYNALQYTHMFLQSNAFNALEAFWRQLPCLEDEYFLCGLYAQLEEYDFFNPDMNPVIRSSYDEVLGKLRDVLTESLLVQAWATMVDGRNLRHDLPKKGVSRRRDCLRNPSNWFKQSSKPKQYRWALRKCPLKKSEHSPIPTDLLMAGWSKCEEIKAFYCDDEIHKYYAASHDLDIVRLSGDILDKDNCYINLAIIQYSGEPTEGTRRKVLLGFSLSTRVHVEVFEKDKQVSLPDLFESSKGHPHPPGAY